jgi:ketosteroid isomerase-like protein
LRDSDAGYEQASCGGRRGPVRRSTTPLRREFWTASPEAAYILLIADERGSESERLARRYFALFEEGDLTQLLELMHPDIEVVVKSTRPGEVLRGRAAVAAFAREQIERLFESTAEVYEPLDETRIVVEGRMRWLDDQRVLRDDPMVWALEFSDGLLRRSTPAHSVLEAKMILAAREDG